jgi:hypothetical protein
MDALLTARFAAASSCYWDISDIAVGQIAEYVVMEFVRDSEQPVPIAILLLDPETHRLYVRCREFASLGDAEDAEMVSTFLEQLADEASVAGGATMLSELEDSLSNAVQLSERMPVPTADIVAALSQLYDRYLTGIV